MQSAVPVPLIGVLDGRYGDAVGAHVPLTTGSEETFRKLNLAPRENRATGPPKCQFRRGGRCNLCREADCEIRIGRDRVAMTEAAT